MKQLWTFTSRVLLLAAPPMLAACTDLSRPPPSSGLLADRYPCDRGIGGDADVVWAENFEEGSVSAVTARYSDHKNAGGMSLGPDRPSRSCGTASMKFTAGGATAATDLYQRFERGHEELYVRWYAKYQAGAPWHHTGVWFGGYDPPSNWPNPQAGTRPLGHDRVSFALEPVWASGATRLFDFYNYWMKMHTCSSCGGSYWGNALISRNAFTVENDQWACLEVHAKLNTDMVSAAGAVLEVWKNDVLVQRFDQSTGVGYWVQDHFCPETADGRQCTDYAPPGGTPMIPLDLQMRTTMALRLNYFWPQNYITAASAGSVWFDDMVVAKVRIGCLR